MGFIVGAVITAIAGGITSKYMADKQAGEIRKAQEEAQRQQEELAKAKGPAPTESNETYNSIMGKRLDMFKKGLMSTIKTNNFGLLDTGTGLLKTKLGQ